MKRNLTFLIGLFSLLSCDKMDFSSSQADSFIKFYNTFPVFKGADIKEVPGRGYAMIGTVTTNTENDQICLIRTDRFGNSLDSARYFGGSNNETAYQLEVLDNKDLIILGSTVNSSGKKQPYLIHTDSLGTVIKERVIQSAENAEAFKFRINAGDSIIMVGTADYARIGSKLNPEIYLFGVDQNFVDLWLGKPQYIGFPEEDVGKDLQLLSDGKIIVTGYSTRSGVRHAFSLKTGKNGSGGSLFTFDNDLNEGKCIQAIDNNTFIILGTTYANASSNEGDVMLEKITYSSTGVTKVWDQTFGSAEDDAGECLHLDGERLHLLATMGSSGTNTSISLITTDLNGEDPQYFTFGEGSHLVARSFEMTADKGFIIAGTNERSSSDISMAVLKLNAQGQLH